MYKINGYYPTARCVCGRTHILRRATVCPCGVTIRIGNVCKRRYSKRWRLYGVAPDNYNEKAQPYRVILDTGWVKASGHNGKAMQ